MKLLPGHSENAELMKKFRAKDGNPRDQILKFPDGVLREICEDGITFYNMWSTTKSKIIMNCFASTSQIIQMLVKWQPERHSVMEIVGCPECEDNWQHKNPWFHANGGESRKYERLLQKMLRSSENVRKVRKNSSNLNFIHTESNSGYWRWDVFEQIQ